MIREKVQKMKHPKDTVLQIEMQFIPKSRTKFRSYSSDNVHISCSCKLEGHPLTQSMNPKLDAPEYVFGLT